MGIYEILESKKDIRKGSDICDFNGYLEDYIDSVDEEEKIYPVFKKLLEHDDSLRVIVNLKTSVSKESISNQIIRYKDIFKLGNQAIVLPWIIYSKKGEEQKALLIVNDDYICAKGMYYSLTEPSSEFQEVKNDIVAVGLRNTDEVVEAFEKLYTKRAGQIQRDLDHKHFKNYDEAYEHALELSNSIGDNLITNSKECEDKEMFIRSCVSRWFLIKKYVYVQFMVDKSILNTKFEGNVKAQRNQAKQNADSIRFVSILEIRKAIEENA